MSPDSKTKILVSGSDDKSIKLWDLDLDFDLESLMVRSCDEVGNYLVHNPNVKKENRRLCEGIGTRK